MGVTYISKEKLRDFLKNPRFVAYAPGGKTAGGVLDGKFYMLKRGVV